MASKPPICGAQSQNMKTSSRNSFHGVHSAEIQHEIQHEFLLADSPVFPRMSTSQPLSNIEEESPMCLPLVMSSYNPPETPQEPMEFLSRSWSISALEVAKAFNNPIDARRKLEDCEHNASAEQHALVSAPFSFASAMTAQIVMEKIMSHSDASPFTSRRNSYSSGALSFMGNGPTIGSPPFSPRQAEDLSAWLLLQQGVHPEMSSTECLHNNKHFCRSFSGVRGPLRGMSMKRWLKDMREKKKEALRFHNSQVHAAVSVAGVAAAIAAIAASTASSSSEGHNKTTMAVASAAALVAAQCVEMAESMGADHEQMSAVVSSAVRVKTPGDVMTLTAAAATALRGAATLKARTLKNHHSHATVIPYDRGSNNLMSFSGEFASEDSESEFCNQDFLRRGCEFLKRTRKGELHWRLLYVYLNKNSQVVVKSQSKYMGGTITKSKKRYVQDVLMHIPAWPGRDILDGADQRRYFGIKTDHGVMELECKNEADYRLWTEGISRLLSHVQHQRPL